MKSLNRLEESTAAASMSLAVNGRKYGVVAPS
jgi:hypothetical protein